MAGLLTTAAMLAVPTAPAHARSESGRSTAPPASATAIAPGIPVLRESEDVQPADIGAGGVVFMVVGCFVLAGVLLMARGGGSARGSGVARLLRLGRMASAGSSTPGPRRLSSTRLTPTHSVHVIQWQGRELLVGCSGDAMQVLAQSVAAPAFEASRQAAPVQPEGFAA
jgi:hypothetical protein